MAENMLCTIGIPNNAPYFNRLKYRNEGYLRYQVSSRKERFQVLLVTIFVFQLDLSDVKIR